MLPDTTSYVPYYRVSTARQGQSGLGLEAQRAAVQAFVADSAQLLGEFVEVESGKKNQRPQLLAALAAARAAGATLLIAKLDRLSRNAGFIFALRDSGVAFICCDMPDANKNRDVFEGFDHMVYTLAATKMKGTQFIIIDKELFPPQSNTKLDIAIRHMTPDEEENPPLIRGYRGL